MSTQPQLAEAVNQVDKLFGSGYAREHPELIGRYLIAHAIQEIDETIASTAQSLLDLPDKMGSVLKFLGIKK